MIMPHAPGIFIVLAQYDEYVNEDDGEVAEVEARRFLGGHKIKKSLCGHESKWPAHCICVCQRG